MWKKAVILFLILPNVCGIVGFSFQQLAVIRDKQLYPATGQFVDVGEHHLHFHVTGEPIENRPKIILEAGNGGFSSQWVYIQQALSEYTQVVSYDRAGLGWSESDNSPRDILASAEQLHIGLENLGIAPPYILVGHSMGGLFVRGFASLYPDDIAGIVLIDSAHPEQFEHFPAEIVEQQASVTQLMQFVEPLSHLGMLRVVHPLSQIVATLPEQQRRESLALSATPRYVRTFIEETDIMNNLSERMPNTGGLGDMPLLVFSADSAPNGQTLPENYFEIAHDLQSDLTTLSSNSQWHIIEGANHFSIIMDENYAQQIALDIDRVMLALVFSR